MTYTREMAQAEANLQAAMHAWRITRQENPSTGRGVFVDSDTRQNGAVVPTRMEYVRHGNELQVTRIAQGNQVIYDQADAATCRASNDEISNRISAFFLAQPQMEAVFNAFPTPMGIPYNCSSRAR